MSYLKSFLILVVVTLFTSCIESGDTIKNYYEKGPRDEVDNDPEREIDEEIAELPFRKYLRLGADLNLKAFTESVKLYVNYRIVNGLEKKDLSCKISYDYSSKSRVIPLGTKIPVDAYWLDDKNNLEVNFMRFRDFRINDISCSINKMDLFEEKDEINALTDIFTDRNNKICITASGLNQAETINICE